MYSIGCINCNIYIYFVVTPPLRPKIWPTNRTITLMNDITNYTILCMTVGARVYIYRWRKHPHRSIPKNLNFSGRLTNVLKLFNLQPHHAGNYQCRVKNGSGVSYSNISTLIIKGLFC